MKELKYIILLFLVLSTLSRKHTYAQDNTPFADENIDDLGNVSDTFQEAFFEALKQKGIENHDRAISSLDDCIAIDDSFSILYFEKGKNYQALNNNEQAEINFLKALELKPNQEPVLNLLYDLYYENRDFENGETILKQLIPFDSQYKEDLARLYRATRDYDKALTLLDELDAEKGNDRARNNLRERIYKLTGRKNLQKDALNKELEANAQSEQDYLKLIYLYSEQGNTEKAYETALKLQKVNPGSDAVQLALYKIDLSKGNTENAINAMSKVLSSSKISAKAKHRVLNDFLLFVNDNPGYSPQLEAAIATFDSQVEDSKIYENIGEYYLKKGATGKALPYLISALSNDADNLTLLQQVLEVELAQGKFENASQRAKAALDLYPSQPLLYYSYGVALKELGKLDEATQQLETGADYVIDDTLLEARFYEQLGDAYSKLGNTKNARRYIDQALKLRAGN
jgi:tetratricopeptide (TPR) repeat protein